MFTIRSADKKGQPSFQVDIAPNWPILDQTRTNWLTGRPAVVGKVPIYPETRMWVLEPAVEIYKTTKLELEINRVSDSPIKTAIRDINWYDCIRHEDLLKLLAPHSFILFDIDSPKEAASTEAYLKRKMGSKMLRMVFKNNPVLEDPVLRRAIDSSLAETEDDILLAVEARKIHETSANDESVKIIRQAIGKKVDRQLSAMLDTMTELAYVSDTYLPKHKPELSAADKRAAFAEMVIAIYGRQAEP